ncbi:hypothetical protein [Prochlorothrix hollandica]|nr:hypothetical protein [Prochlorothrix hollandica]
MVHTQQPGANYQDLGRSDYAPSYPPPGHPSIQAPAGTPGYPAQYSYGYPEAEPGAVPASYLMDPSLLRAARHLYRQFYEVHPDVTDRPIGVAVNRYSYRGKLIFGKRPILLPQECLIPFEQIQSELY